MRIASTVARLSGLLSLGVAFAAAPQARHVASAGVYTTAQAASGARAYTAHCASCHGAQLQGIDSSPPLIGIEFLSNWLNQSAAALFTRIETTMPQNHPGSLGSGTIADVMAYLFQANGFPAGSNSLPSSADELAQIRIDLPKMGE